MHIAAWWRVDSFPDYLCLARRASGFLQPIHGYSGFLRKYMYYLLADMQASGGERTQYTCDDCNLTVFSGKDRATTLIDAHHMWLHAVFPRQLQRNRVFLAKTFEWKTPQKQRT